MIQRMQMIAKTMQSNRNEQNTWTDVSQKKTSKVSVHVNKCSRSLVTREGQIKTAVRQYLAPFRLLLKSQAGVVTDAIFPAIGRLMQKHSSEFEASLGYVVRFKPNRTKPNQLLLRIWRKGNPSMLLMAMENSIALWKTAF